MAKKQLFTIEDGAISGGAGSAVSEWAQENKMQAANCHMRHSR